MFRITEQSIRERIFTYLLSKFTFTTAGGLRVDASGATVPVSSTGLGVTALSGASLGRNSVDGQGIQQSQLNYVESFRRNLVVT